MKNIKLGKFAIILLGFTIFLSINPAAVFAQTNCKNTGESQKFTFENATGKPVEIKILDDNCNETPGKLLNTGDKIGGTAFTGTMFRVYDIATGKMISEVKLDKSKTLYKIEIIKKEIPPEDRINPAIGFLETTNEIRADKNLPAMQPNDILTNACQFFAEQMAQADKGPAHTLKEIGLQKLYKDRDKTSQRLIYYGWNTSTAYYEVTAIDSVEDYNTLGKHFAELWAFSTTHYKPFYDKDRVTFNQVGFGVAKAEKGNNKYYACAIFGKL